MRLLCRYHGGSRSSHDAQWPDRGACAGSQWAKKWVGKRKEGGSERGHMRGCVAVTCKQARRQEEQVREGEVKCTCKMGRGRAPSVRPPICTPDAEGLLTELAEEEE